MNKRITGFQIFSMAVLIIASLIVAYPLLLTLRKSLIINGLANYPAVLRKVNIPRNLMNSIIVVGITLIGTTIVCSSAAFAFSKLHFRGRNILFLVIMMGMMVPTSAMIFPLFQIIKFLKLVNNPISQTLPYITGNSIFGLLLLKIYFDGLPNEMMESARIDGAGSLRIFAQIMLPNAIPGLSILFVNTFMGTWNELQIAITFISKRDYMTIAAIPVNFASGMGTTNNSTGELFACLVMCMIPVILFYILVQKMIIRGMTEGTVKG
ncbi:MAG: carbohydrate ABC transporter permease [Treponema sp.]|jgi:raffinose/stachyose/melibiose transport system permease protein|nr:carbohydrate ABC transporter permease [Treponema sp.]